MTPSHVLIEHKYLAGLRVATDYIWWTNGAGQREWELRGFGWPENAFDYLVSRAQGNLQLISQSDAESRGPIHFRG